MTHFIFPEVHHHHYFSLGITFSLFTSKTDGKFFMVHHLNIKIIIVLTPLLYQPPTQERMKVVEHPSLLDFFFF